jgi:Protein of unknown function DUF262
MSRGGQWTVGENEMAIEPVFDWLGPPPWDRVPPTPLVAEWAEALHEREPRHSVSSWDAKIRDVLSRLPIRTVKSNNGRPAGSVRTMKSGAKGPTLEGPSTRELVERRLAAMSAPHGLEDGEGGTFEVSETQGTEVPVEYDSLGLSTGVEAEEQAPEPLIHDPFDPAKIDVITRTMTVDLLLARIRRGVLDLAPDFQRFAGIWNDVAQSKLIESLLLRIPLPTLYAAESGEESWVVVDGIQRLTAIARFVDPSIVGSSPLRLHGMEYLRAYEGATYQQLPGALQTRIDETELIVHNLADRCSVLITGHDQSARSDPGRVTGLIQKRPHVARLVLIIEISGDVDTVHLSPPPATDHYYRTRDSPGQDPAQPAASPAPGPVD